jgi:hypothetical protein
MERVVYLFRKRIKWDHHYCSLWISQHLSKELNAPCRYRRQLGYPRIEAEDNGNVHCNRAVTSMPQPSTRKGTDISSLTPQLAAIARHACSLAPGSTTPPKSLPPRTQSVRESTGTMCRAAYLRVSETIFCTVEKALQALSGVRHLVFIRLYDHLELVQLHGHIGLKRCASLVFQPQLAYFLCHEGAAEVVRNFVQCVLHHRYRCFVSSLLLRRG